MSDETKRARTFYDAKEEALRIRCFMDGIDWQHHLDSDADGTTLYPCEETLRDKKTCLKGGCGVVEVEVRLIRWVEPQNLKYESASPNPTLTKDTE